MKGGVLVVFCMLLVLPFVSAQIPNPGHEWPHLECTDVFCIDPISGRVGIGDTTPDSKLHVREPTGSVIAVDSGGPPEYSAIDFYDNGVNKWGIGKNPGNNFYIDLFGVGNALTIDGNRNVGIGTATPTAKLEIASGISKVVISPTSGGGGWLGVSRPSDGLISYMIGPSAVPTEDGVIYSGGGSTELRLISAGGSSDGFGFYTAPGAAISGAVAFGGARPVSNLVMKITGDGNIGLGTTTPNQKLEVAGGIKLSSPPAQPVCDITVRGTVWHLKGAAGLRDRVEFCLKNADGTFSWQEIGAVVPPIDADNDGFPAFAAGGTDCVDNDPAINPASGVTCNYGVTCTLPPPDDAACGTVSCSTWYVQSGTESATATETCFNKADITSNRCENYNDCKDANSVDCNVQSDNAAQYSCGTCKYISASSCTGTTLGSCSDYASGTNCGGSNTCDGNGNCLAPPASGCADGATEEFFADTSSGKKVQGCNALNQRAQRANACAAGWHVGDVVNDAGLSAVLQNDRGTQNRWIDISGGPSIPSWRLGNTFCWATQSGCAGGTIESYYPLHAFTNDGVAYYNGVQMLANWGWAALDFAEAGSICVEGAASSPSLYPITEDISPSVDEARGVAVDGSGLYVVGFDLSPGTDHQWRMEKRDPVIGTLIWAQSTNPSSNTDQAKGVAVDSSGIYVAGSDGIFGSSNQQFRIEKRDKSTGSIIWTQTSNPSSERDAANGVALDGSGVYIVGESDQGLQTRWHMEKRSLSTGSLMWSQQSDPSPENDVANSVAVDGSGIYVVGQDRSPGPGTPQWRIEKRSLSSGSVLWSQTSILGTPNSVAVDGSGVYIGGHRGLEYWRIEKRSLSTGSLLWSQEINPSGSLDVVHGMAVDSTGIYMSGYDYVPGNRQWRMEKRSTSTGSLLWSQTSNPTSVDDIAWAIAVDGSGPYVVGRENWVTNSMWRIEKRDLSTGAQI